MKKGESRFFLNWQISQECSKKLCAANSEVDRKRVVCEWLKDQGIYSCCEHLRIKDREAKAIIEQFMGSNCEFAHRQKFTEKKMACFLEIMLYILKIIIE